MRFFTCAGRINATIYAFSRIRGSLLLLDAPPIAKPKVKPKTKPLQAARSGTFTDNMRLPVHRWFRYSAGFSAEWAEGVINNHGGKGCTVLDPFAGSGTTLIAAQNCGAAAYGFESHPFVQRIAEAKLSWSADVGAFVAAAGAVKKHHGKWEALAAEVKAAPELMQKCYSADALAQLYALRNGFKKESAKLDPASSRLVWLAITGILRACSGVGTAQWQYVLPNKSKAKVLEPLTAFDAKVEQMAADMLAGQGLGWNGSAHVFAHDSRNKQIPIEPGSVDLVVTSPPYANNYDYADATRLEMMFWGEISGWGDLQDAVRQHIIRSCSQHAAADRVDLTNLLTHSRLSAIGSEISDVCNELAEVRLGKGGKKAYHTMVAAYFYDMAATFGTLRKACRDGARMCFVVGDSAPYGVYVPVDHWLGRLAVAAGFKSYSFDKLRDRNTKWKNRKHTVPLHEGHLWIEG
ncbi:MAG TPA: DNA methyltransferase [Xylella sp.]